MRPRLSACLPLLAQARNSRRPHAADAGARAFERHLATRLGCIAKVLIERPGFGRAEDFTPVHLDGVPAGDIAAARLVALGDRALEGELLAGAAAAPGPQTTGFEAGL